jgi:hypothetical protein
MILEELFIFEDNPAKQFEYLEAAYFDAMTNGFGIIVPKDVLERYKEVKSNSSKKLISTVKEYYDSSLKGKVVNVSANGNIVRIHFEDDGKRKSVGWRMTPEKAAIFEQLIPLLENATYAYSQKNRNEIERKYVPAFHYFVNNASAGGVNIPVKIQIREINSAHGAVNKYYTHNFINKRGSAGPGLPQ